MLSGGRVFVKRYCLFFFDGVGLCCVDVGVDFANLRRGKRLCFCKKILVLIGFYQFFSKSLRFISLFRRVLGPGEAEQPRSLNSRGVLQGAGSLLSAPIGANIGGLCLVFFGVR